MAEAVDAICLSRFHYAFFFTPRS